MYSNEQPTIKYRRDYQPSHYLIKKTYLDFELFEEYVLVHSRLVIETNPASKTTNSDLALNGVELELLSLKIDDQPLSDVDYQLSSDRLTLKPNKSNFVLSASVKIYPNKNTSLEGLYLSNGKFCTQCEAEGFRKITYYIDRPDIMSEFFVSITADKDTYPFLLSNGNLTDSQVLENGKHKNNWHDPFPKPSYLFALVAGNYDRLKDQYITASGRKVELELFVELGKLDQCRFAMDSLINAMKWDEEKYGREYDLDLYMIVAVSDFNMGAMENKGLNVFNTAYVLANKKTATDSDFEGVERVIAHEYFHNWTGNRITCRDWFQLSLKEGLTVFRDQQFSEDMQSAAVERIDQVKIIRAAQFAEDSGPMAHPIRPDSYIEMNNFYTVTVYNKGAEVIRMMHTLLGKQGFRAGMDYYFSKYDGQAVTCEDFINSMETANEVDWSLFRNWYRQSGTPELNVKLESDLVENNDRKLTFEFEQFCNGSPDQVNKKPFMIPIRIGFIDGQGTPLAFTVAPDTSSTNETLYVLEESQKKLELTFTNTNKDLKIIPSLLRNFSAPVKLHYDYDQNQLATLFAHDSDPFNRWDAGQKLLSQLLLGDEFEISLNDLDIVKNAIANVLQDKQLDPSLKALAVQIPSLNSIIGEAAQINLDALSAKFRQLKTHLASSLENLWLKTYTENDSIETPNSGTRRLKNVALGYLLESDPKQHFSIAKQQLTQSDNMTDELSALQVIANTRILERQDSILAFYQKWCDEELVMDKWFSAQVNMDHESVLTHINQLLTHEKFSITNPNKVRALIGAFIAGNTLQFHCPTGSGYELLTKMVIGLNEINPQIAARLAKQFGQWQKFDNKRQAIIREQLEIIIAVENLSNDVYEIVDKSLNINEHQS
jgi:aminopeptidase N